MGSGSSTAARYPPAPPPTKEPVQEILEDLAAARGVRDADLRDAGWKIRLGCSVKRRRRPHRHAANSLNLAESSVAARRPKHALEWALAAPGPLRDALAAFLAGRYADAPFEFLLAAFGAPRGTKNKK